MKIVRIIPVFDYGGVERVLLNACQCPQYVAGNDVTIIILGQGGRMSSQLLDHGIAIIELGHKFRIPNIFLLFRLVRILNSINPDVVHCQSSEANFHGAIAAFLTKVPVRICEEVGIPNHHSIWRFVFRFVYALSTHVIAISDAVAHRIIKLGEVSLSKINVIYNPSSISSFEKQVEPTDLKLEEMVADLGRFVFVTTCRLVPVKNLERLILSFSDFVRANPSGDFALWIVGEGHERRKLELLAQQYNLSAVIRFFGYRENVNKFLLAADVFVLPSLSEGSSVSLAEAMMAGLPSIVTKVGGADEILGRSRSGVLIDPLNNESIVAAMQSLFDLSDDERAQMGFRAKEEGKRFSVEVYIESLLGIYYS